MNSFGIYENFPNTCHYVAVFEFKAPLNALKSAILNALYNLNRLENIPKRILPKTTMGLKVIFEFGIADGSTFNYLDEETLRDSMKKTHLNIYRIMDFICIIRYYKPASKIIKRFRALRFDYYLLRFIFGRDVFEIRVFHEKGLQRIDAKTLIEILAEGVNSELLEKDENPIKIKALWFSGLQVV